MDAYQKAVALASIPSSFSRRVYSSINRAVRWEHLDLRFSQTLQETYLLRFVPPENKQDNSTAYWFWSPRPEPGRHIISLNLGLTNNATKTKKNLEGYFIAHYRHEVAHGEWTMRDLKSLGQELKDTHVPFRLWNLFEDARIEHLWRDRFHQPFNWLFWEEPTASLVTDDPLKLFFSHIQNDGQPRPLHTPKQEKIYKYYLRACQAPNSLAIIPIIKDWLLEFASLDLASLPTYLSDGLDSWQLALDPKAQAKLLSAIQQEREEEQPPDEKRGTRTPDGKHDEYNLPVGQTDIISSTPVHPFDVVAAEQLLTTLRRLFQARRGRSVTEVPSKRISVRHWLRNSPRYYRHRDAVGELFPDGRGRPSVILIYDCSGSMGIPSVQDSGQALIYALQGLARYGLLEGFLALTRVMTPYSQFQVLPWSSPQLIPGHIPSNGGGEGFADTMESLKKALCQADYVFCYTDGDITDRKVDRPVWHSRGVYTTGLYVRHAENFSDQDAATVNESLRKWFDSSIVRNNTRELAEALIQHVGLHRRRS